MCLVPMPLLMPIVKADQTDLPPQAWACSVGLQTDVEDVTVTINQLTEELEINKSSLADVSSENQAIRQQLEEQSLLSARLAREIHQVTKQQKVEFIRH